MTSKDRFTPVDHPTVARAKAQRMYLASLSNEELLGYLCEAYHVKERYIENMRLEEGHEAMLDWTGANWEAIKRMGGGAKATRSTPYEERNTE